MNRITRDQLHMEIANLFAKRSTCYRQNIGAVLTTDGHIVSAGYNGSLPGHPHCEGKECPLTESGGCSRSIHAEINALKYAPPCYSPLTLYVSQSPCEACALALIEDGRVEKVFYNNEYRLKRGIELLIAKDIEVYRITPSGYVINAKNNAICTAD